MGPTGPTAPIDLPLLISQLSGVVRQGTLGPARELIYALSIAITGTGPRGPTGPFGPTGAFGPGVQPSDS